MDMTKEALAYIVGLKKAEILEINGEFYTDRAVSRVDRKLRAEPIKMSTLTSLVDYLKSDTDEMQPKMLVHIVSPDCVRVISMLDCDRKREDMVEVHASVPDFDYGRYMDKEKFIIAMQSKFISGGDRDLLLKFAGTVRDESIAEYGDDGVSQRATIKTGISTVGDAVVPSPAVLRPFRTFLEVEQPESSFIFRMRQNEGREVECALFEADGGAWKNVAMSRIKDYLEMELLEFPKYTIIS